MTAILRFFGRQMLTAILVLLPIFASANGGAAPFAPPSAATVAELMTKDLIGARGKRIEPNDAQSLPKVLDQL
jgi:hypothetical protein